MKKMRMIWVGASHEGHVTAGKTYLIVGKSREVEKQLGIIWYSYEFVDDAGQLAVAASNLFLKPKPHIGQRRSP